MVFLHQFKLHQPSTFMKTLYAIIAIVLLIATAACVSSRGSIVYSRLANIQFAPATLKIKANTTVVWQNYDSVPHRLASGTLFTSPELAKGQKFNHTFNQPGNFTIVCTIHPSMKQTIVVQ